MGSTLLLLLTVVALCALVLACVAAATRGLDGAVDPRG